MSHTPGPWGFTGEPYGYTIWQTARECNDFPQAVARIVGGRIKVEQEEDNARLVAAAPDLLAELERMYEAARMMADPEHCLYEHREHLPWKDLAAKAKTAISKARG